MYIFSFGQSSLISIQVPDRIHLFGSKSSLSMFRLAVKMYVAPLMLV
jgi:hypothetical protein